MELGESSKLFNQTELIEQIKLEHVRTAAITSGFNQNWYHENKALKNK